MKWSKTTAPARPADAGSARAFHPSLLLAAALLCLAQLEARARVNVDAIPNRDSVQLTIYNSADLTMVRETRFLTLRQGINHLDFSWANTLIDPTSVEFKALTHADEVHVLDVRFPPRVTNTLEWTLQSEFAGEVQVEILYFTSGISWSADYVLEAARDEKTASLSGFITVKMVWALSWALMPVVTPSAASIETVKFAIKLE